MADAHVCGGCEEKEKFEKREFADERRPEGVHVILRKPTREERAEFMPTMINEPSIVDADVREEART